MVEKKDGWKESEKEKYRKIDWVKERKKKRRTKKEKIKK